MKTMKKVMLTIMMVMISTLVIANDNKPTVKVENVEAKTIGVIAYGLGEVKTDIQLINSNGKVFYKETVKSGENFAKKLELAAIPAGEYTLEVDNSESFTAIPVVMNTDSAIAKVADQVTIVKPKLALSGDKLNVFFTDNVTNEIWVSIYDASSNRLAYEKLSADKLKRFDLSKLEKGEYIIHMFAGGKKFVQSLSLNK